MKEGKASEKVNTNISDLQCKKWIGEMAEGSTEALKLLYESMYRPLLLFVMSVLRNPVIAEDIVQETFIKVYQKADQFQKKSTAKTWIFSIAKHLCMDLIAAKQYDNIPDHIICSDGDFSRLETNEALNQLEAEEQQVIILYVFGGFKIKKIAELLSISEKQAYYRKKTATEKLKSYFTS